VSAVDERRDYRRSRTRLGRQKEWPGGNSIAPLLMHKSEQVSTAARIAASCSNLLQLPDQGDVVDYSLLPSMNAEIKR
jgi:hypothetical protein